jgi:hypothetical protein
VDGGYALQGGTQLTKLRHKAAAEMQGLQITVRGQDAAGRRDGESASE